MPKEDEIEDLKLRVTKLEQTLFGKSPKIVPDEGDDVEPKPRPPKKKKP